MCSILYGINLSSWNIDKFSLELSYNFHKYFSISFMKSNIAFFKLEAII
jgi:hypothetical protein